MTPDHRPGEGQRSAVYDDVREPDRKGKHVDDLRVRVIAFRDFSRRLAALQESSFFTLPEEQASFAAFVQAWCRRAAGTRPNPGLRPWPWPQLPVDDPRGPPAASDRGLD